MAGGNRKAIVAALVANFGIALAKFAGFFVTGAASMLAEAVHSVADPGTQSLLLWGNFASQRAPDPSHPFGYARERYFWAFVVSLILFALGSLFALREGILRLIHPHEVGEFHVAMLILLLGIGLEGASFFTAYRIAKDVKGRAGWWAFIRRTKNPELPVVLLEDLGALIGLLIAMIGVGLSALTGDARYDAAGSIAIGILLGVIATILAIEMKSLLIGEGASAINEAGIRQAVQNSPGVSRLIHMKTQHLGPEELLIAAKVEFAPNVGVEELTHAIDAAESAIREQLAPVAAIIYLEPDIYERHDEGAKAETESQD